MRGRTPTQVVDMPQSRPTGGRTQGQAVDVLPAQPKEGCSFGGLVVDSP